MKNINNNLLHILHPFDNIQTYTAVYLFNIVLI